MMHVMRCFMAPGKVTHSPAAWPAGGVVPYFRARVLVRSMSSVARVTVKLARRSAKSCGRAKTVKVSSEPRARVIPSPKDRLTCLAPPEGMPYAAELLRLSAAAVIVAVQDPAITDASEKSRNPLRTTSSSGAPTVKRKAVYIGWNASVKGVRLSTPLMPA